MNHRFFEDRMMKSIQKPLVSVVVPAYNMELYIAETLDSVLASTYENIEVVVVDDGSKDATVSIVEQYMTRDSCVKLIKQKNAGPSRARNNAIEHCCGEYILPVDADDLISPTFIGSAVEAIESDSEIKVVSCRCEFFGLRKGEWMLPDFTLKDLALDNRVCATSMYRRSDWQRAGGYSETIIAREDWAFWIAMLKDGGKVHRLPEVGLYYRVRAASKRFQDRKLKGFVVKRLNRMFPDFFERELGGRLYVQRSHSSKINALLNWLCPKKVEVDDKWSEYYYFAKALPRIVGYARKDGLQVKFGNREVVFAEYGVALGSYKNSSAHKAWLEARSRGENMVGYCAERKWLVFNKSYLIKSIK